MRHVILRVGGVGSFVGRVPYHGPTSGLFRDGKPVIW